jgi:endothelin-converting enzyme/putative endopeptidase
MRSRAPLLLAILLVAPAGAQEKRPLASLPYTSSLDPSAMDRSVSPCEDLYRFSCGGWMKNNPIPPDQPRWSVYGKLADENQQYLWGILEAAATPDWGRPAPRRKIGDYFAACMDEPSVEQAGVSALGPELAAIESIRSIDRIAAFLGAQHLRSGGGMMFGFGADQDPKDSERVIAWAVAGGLGLPDRDYYVKDDAKSKETRERYEAHVGRMLALLGAAPQEAKRGAATVLRLETALAQASLTRVERRDPHRIYHKMSVAKIQDLTPSFSWKRYLRAAGASSVREMNVTEPAFFKELDARLRAESLADWKTYLRWHLARERAPYLSSSFVMENFDFYRGYLRGVKAMQPRWKRCVGWVDRDLGEALGQVFVEKTFDPETRARTLEMVRRIESAMEARIRSLDWMGDATKARALDKLHAVRNKIGYPDRWRDYGPVEVRRDDFLGNVLRAAEFESRRQLGKIGKRVDREEWGMTPPTVNAYYNPSMNDINFPAGVLQPPLFDPRLDDAPNYGNTGATIGHELIHGFDDEGRQFDARGNLTDWWTEADAKEFEKRAACIAEQYAQYVVVDDVKINSRLTLGEDVADLGGTILAWEAWKGAVAGKTLEDRDGLTPEQRFFVGYAQWACENDRDENLRLDAVTNPHSPGKYRINGVAANMPEFREAFACRPDQAQVREQVCRIW